MTNPAQLIASIMSNPNGIILPQLLNSGGALTQVGGTSPPASTPSAMAAGTPPGLQSSLTTFAVNTGLANAFQNGSQRMAFSAMGDLFKGDFDDALMKGAGALFMHGAAQVADSNARMAAQHTGQNIQNAVNQTPPFIQSALSTVTNPQQIGTSVTNAMNMIP